MLAALALCVGASSGWLAAPVAARGQDAAALDRARGDEHRAVVLGERMLRFVERLAAAEPAQVEAVLEQLESARPTGASAHWSPSVEQLRRASGLLDPADELRDQDWPTLDRLAGSLDLVATPGAFELGAEGGREPITVHVRRAWGESSAEVELVLEWIDAAGERSHARREPVAASAFSAGGFPMYLRAPDSAAGRCHLLGQLVRRPAGKFAALTSAVRVDAVERLRARLDALRKRGRIDQPGYRRLEELLSRLLVAGLRGSTALGGGELLLALERWSEQGPAPGLLVPIERSFESARGAESWLWSYSPQREPERALVFVAHSSECVEQVFSGELGSAWLDFAERSSTQLFATHAPRAGAHVDEWLARLREWAGELELVLVARGDALGVLGAVETKAPIAAWVVVSSAPAASCAASLIERPGLLIAPGPAPQGRTGIEWIEGPRLWFAGEPRLLERVEAWLARRARAR